jgi:hypothetical protein
LIREVVRSFQLQSLQSGLSEETRYLLHPVVVSVEDFPMDGTLLVRGEQVVLVIECELPEGTPASIRVFLDSSRFELPIRIGRTLWRSESATYLEVVHQPKDRIDEATWRRLTRHGWLD